MFPLLLHYLTFLGGKGIINMWYLLYLSRDKIEFSCQKNVLSYLSIFMSLYNMSLLCSILLQNFLKKFTFFVFLLLLVLFYACFGYKKRTVSLLSKFSYTPYVYYFIYYYNLITSICQIQHLSTFDSMCFYSTFFIVILHKT